VLTATPGSLFVDFFVKLLYLSSAQSSFSSSSEPSFSPSAQRYCAAGRRLSSGRHARKHVKA
jgi:hypothetical protein